MTPTLRIIFLTAFLLVLLCSSESLRFSPSAAAKRPPNFVIIFADDLGYADVGSFGATGYATPHLDRMAREGIRLTNFYVSQAVCSASRASLLTGCYANRVGIRGALFPDAKNGLHHNELTIAEILKPRGYATAIFGKWHLGDHPKFLPPQQGFDEYFGLPYSNDMWPEHPTVGDKMPPLRLIEGDRIIAESLDQTQLTTWYTERAVRFIERSKDQPFFLYVPHLMPHVPLFVSDKFKGKTPRGLYGDVLAEIDWSVGQILDALKRHKLDDNTLVIFTSDNGPWLEFGDHGGSKGALRGSKGNMFEGGVRVPFIARWPKQIPAGSVNHQAAMTIDLLPTLAQLAGAAVPKDRIIDGRNIWSLLAAKKNARTPHEALYFYWSDQLHAVRSGKWKLHLPHNWTEVTEQGNGGKPGKNRQSQIELSLFDLDKDIGETTNVADQHPAVVKQLMTFVERARLDLGDSLVNRQGKNVRPTGQLE